MTRVMGTYENFSLGLLTSLRKINLSIHGKTQNAFFTLSRLAILAAHVHLADVVVPALWQHYEHQPGLVNLPMVTTTMYKIDGDTNNSGM